MSWLDGLSAALTAGTQGATGWLQGQQQYQREAQALAEKAAEQLRRKHLDEQAELMQKAQLERWKADDARQKLLDTRQGTLDVMGALKEGYQPIEETAPLKTGSPLDIPFEQIAQARQKNAVELGGRKLAAPLEAPGQRTSRERMEDLQRREQERQEDRAQRLREIAASRAEPSWVYGGVDPASGKSIWVNSKNPDQTKTVDASRATAGRGGATTQRLVADNTKRMAVIDEALKAVEARPQSFGMEFGGAYLGLGGFADELNQRNDPEGVAARSLVANIGSLEIHDRSGAAVTISEFPRLAAFVPQVSNTPRKIMENLRQLKWIIQKHNAALASGNLSSPDVLDRGTGQGMPAAVAAPLGADPSDNADLYATYGLTPPTPGGR